jgi:hypothetical protein
LEVILKLGKNDEGRDNHFINCGNDFCELLKL